MKIRNYESKKVRIEIIPLIDVMFLVLVSFIYGMLSMAIYKGVNVKLPVSKIAETQKTENLSISIDENGLIYVDKQPVELENLADFISKNYENKNVSVLLFADKNVIYQKIFNVLDQIKLAGFSKISLQAKKE
jgi:biopolymer transport protein ExbD